MGMTTTFNSQELHQPLTYTVSTSGSLNTWKSNQPYTLDNPNLNYYFPNIYNETKVSVGSIIRPCDYTYQPQAKCMGCPKYRNLAAITKVSVESGYKYPHNLACVETVTFGQCHIGTPCVFMKTFSLKSDTYSCTWTGFGNPTGVL